MARMRDLTSGARAILGILTGRWVLSGPRSVALAISDVCNTNCLMCWCHSPIVGRSQVDAPRRPPHMDAALFETILRETRELGTFRVVLGGNGDPALHPQFDAMLELMGRLDMEPYVLTNGLALDEGRARHWGARSAHYRFSIHAGDIDTWLAVHPSGTAEQYERLMSTIRVLAASGTPQVSTMHVIHKTNYRRIREMVEQAQALGVRDVLFRPVRASGELAGMVLDPDEEAELRPRLEEALRLAESYGLHTNLREVLANSLYIRQGVMETGHLYRKIPCYIGWIYAEFDLDGTMTPCLHSKIVMGRAGEERLRAIWHSPRYRAFRRESRRMPRTGRFVAGCECHACCMAKFNVNLYNLLHLKSLRYGEA